MPARWDDVPCSIQTEILMYLHLHVLCLLKAVSRGMANRCRGVIRDERWVKKSQNLIVLQNAVSSAYSRIRFPFTVAIFPWLFEPALSERGHVYYELSGAKHLIATIYDMNVYCRLYNDVEERDTAVTLKAFETKQKDLASIGRSEIVDLKMELHGHGIVSSELELRIVLQSILDKLPKKPSVLVKGFTYFRCRDGSHSLEYNLGDDECVRELLLAMRVVTEVGKGRWMQHLDDDTDALNVFHLARNKMGPFKDVTRW